MAIAYAPHRFTVDDLYRMEADGYFAPDARIELLDGEIFERVEVMNPPHATSVQRMNIAVVRRLSAVATIRCQLPVVLDRFSEPHPDFAVVRADPRDYLDGHPRTRDVFFLAEVADSSRDQDRRLKLPLYGRRGVPETWLVDLVDEVVLTYRDPTPDGYGVVTVARRGETVAPLAFPELAIAVDDILPPR